MKKYTINSLIYAIILLLLIICIVTVPSYYTTLHASTIDQESEYLYFKQQASELSSQLDSLSSALTSYEKSLNEFDKRLSELEDQSSALHNLLVNYYVEKLHDPTFVSINTEGHTYYTAAECLGELGKPAIPVLIERLNTTDDYERALILYALGLASQADNVKVFCGNDYIPVTLDFDARNHAEAITAAKAWWDKYKSYFN